MINRLLLASVAIAAAGCGGAGSDILGRNSEIVVGMASPAAAMANLELQIVPAEGAFGAANGCRTDNMSFCSKVEQTATKLAFYFKTNSAASASPYFVWARNKSTVADLPFRIAIAVDGKVKLDSTITLAKGSTTRLARIYRNSIGTGL